MTFRSPRAVFIYLMTGLFYSATGVAMLVAGTGWIAALGIVPSVVGLAYVVLLPRVRVRVDAEFLLVSNHLRKIAIVWSDVAVVRSDYRILSPLTAFNLFGHLVVESRDGTVTPAVATFWSTSRSLSPLVEALNRESAIHGFEVQVKGEHFPTLG